MISQTKDALASAGVAVNTLEAAAAAAGRGAASKAVSRSSTVLLVKNLPYSCTEEELEELFGRCGAVVRMVLPPTRVLALVEYGEPQEARSAFKNLAYKKFHHVPLYLEWAPKEIFSTSAAEAAAAAKGQAKGAGKASSTPAAAAAGGTGAGVEDAKGKGKGKDRAAAGGPAVADGDVTGAAVAAGEDEEGGDGAPVASIYVKNLNFATTDAGLKKHFDKVVSAAGGTIHSAKVSGSCEVADAIRGLGSTKWHAPKQLL